MVTRHYGASSENRVQNLLRVAEVLEYCMGSAGGKVGNGVPSGRHGNSPRIDALAAGNIGRSIADDDNLGSRRDPAEVFNCSLDRDGG